MPNLTVIIDCDEQGNYSVGEEPYEDDDHDGDEGGGGNDGDADDNVQMQPAKDLNDALRIARECFEKAASAEGPSAEEAMRQGYNSTMGMGGEGEEEQTGGNS